MTQNILQNNKIYYVIIYNKIKIKSYRETTLVELM